MRTRLSSVRELGYPLSGEESARHNRREKCPAHARQRAAEHCRVADPGSEHQRAFDLTDRVFGPSSRLIGGNAGVRT